MKKIRLIKPTQEKTIEEAFDEFIRFCKIKNLSEKN
ncbi:MAG: hypothetical protein PWP31_1114 [Clostridia bacterium]|nr:hypothetical protein [Clostridia bacterium]